LVCIASLSGCSGSGDNKSAEEAPISKTFSTKGSIVSNTGSTVQIGSSTFNIASANIVMDEQNANASQLQQGMVVTVSGTRTVSKTDTVEDVEYEDELEGPISSIDLNNESFVVLGVTVATNSDTVFDDIDFSSLVVGNIVEVSGYQMGDSEILATYVELKSEQYNEGDEIEVKGEISSLNVDSQTFQIGSQLIDYSGAEFEDIPNNSLEDGMPVEVESSQGLVDGVLIASKIEYEGDEHHGDEGDEVEVHGVVTDFVSSTDFMVSGISVTTTSSTEYEHGSAANLANGVKVEVEGEFNVSNVLVAEEVEFKLESDLKIESTISAIDADSSTITVLGLEIMVTSTTILIDESESEIEAFTFDDLSQGDFVEVSVYSDDGNIVATKIERDDEDDESEIKGAVESINQPELSVMGIAIITNDNTQFEGHDDQSMTVEEFFNQLQVDDLIEIEGSFDGEVFTASEIEMKHGDDED